MKTLFILDLPLDSEKANVIQVLHMCHAVAYLGETVVLAVPSRQKEFTQALNVIAARQLGKAVNFSIIEYRKYTIVGRFSIMGGYWGVSRLLKQVKPDLVMVRNPVYVTCAIRRGIKTVFEAHNSILHDNTLLDTLYSRQLIRSSQHDELVAFISISENLMKFWRNSGIPEKKSLVLHDGVDTESFQNIPDVAALRQKLGLPNDRKVVAYTGSFYPDREIENILKLAQTEPEVYFVLVGGPDRNVDTIKKKARLEGIHNVHFTGRILHSQVKEYLFAADVLLMVWSKKVRTINYCSPLKVFEYMAAGKTIVGHGFPTILEVLTDGDNALLADPDSFSKLQSKLHEAVSMSADNVLARAARKLAFDEYSWRSRANRLLSKVKL